MGLYVFIQGIRGESANVKHRGWIEAYAYSLGLKNPGSFNFDSASEVTFTDFTINKRPDASTPKIMLAVCTGMNFSQAKIELTRIISGREVVFLSYVLSDVVIPSYDVKLGVSSAFPLEEVTFSFGRITWSYTPFSIIGIPLAPITGGWDLIRV
jgi:type VI secretion system secreted protein Hcp